MPLALWTLLWLNLRATARRVGRQARTPKGAVLLSVGLGVVVLWLLPTVLVGRFVPPTDRDVVRVGGPLLILGLCLLNLLSATGERAVSFSPAEVDFLFPGPFTRRQLLTYKLVKTGSVAALSALLFGLVLGRHGGTFAGRVIGSWFTLQFFQLVAMVAALLTASAGRRTIGRRTLGLGVVAVVAVAVGPTAYRYYPAGGMAVAGHVGDAPLGRAVVAPFAVFARAITTDHLATDGLTWDAAAAGIDAVLVAAVFALDADYLEVAAAASARRSARMSRVRQGGIAGMARATSARLHLPPLPWLAGTGPVVWRQLTTVLRTARGLLTVLAVLAVCVGGAVAHVGADSPADREVASVVIGGAYLFLVSLFLVSLLRFDFRGDVDHLDVLRSLPLRPTAVAAAELVAPTLVLAAAQGLLLAGVAAFGHLPVRWLLAAAAYLLPADALIVGTENLLFLLFPSRPANAVAGDMGAVGRQSVVLFVRLIVMTVVAAVAAAAGTVAYWLTGNRGLAGVVAWVPLAMTVGLVVWLVGLAFARFDPSVETPA